MTTARPLHDNVLLVRCECHDQYDPDSPRLTVFRGVVEELGPEFLSSPRMYSPIARGMTVLFSVGGAVCVTPGVLLGVWVVPYERIFAVLGEVRA